MVAPDGLARVADLEPVMAPVARLKVYPVCAPASKTTRIGADGVGVTAAAGAGLTSAGTAVIGPTSSIATMTRISVRRIGEIPRSIIGAGLRGWSV